MNRNRLGVVVVLAVFWVLGTLILVSELPLIPPAQRVIYASVKLFLIWGTLPLAIRLWRDPTCVWANTLIGVDFAIYTCFAQFYRPMYYFAFSQLGFAYSFIFSVPKKIIRVLFTVWVLAYLAVLWLTWDRYIILMREPQYADIVTTVVAFAFVSIVSHTYFTSDRMFREVALSRFSRLGLQAGRLIHDLKGLTSTPRLYADLVTERLAARGISDAQLTDALNALGSDLENLNRIVIELNQLTTVTASEAKDFNFDDAFESVKSILGNRLRNVTLRCDVQVRLHSDQSVLSSILLNIVLNSLDSFKDKKTGVPEIRLSVRERRIFVEDNGGGIAPEVIRNLSMDKISSTKSKGSGLGLWFVIDGMQNLGGKAKIYNVSGGACVELIFPRKTILPFSLQADPTLA
jgi:signal transduction histidine kinase